MTLAKFSVPTNPPIDGNGGAFFPNAILQTPNPQICGVVQDFQKQKFVACYYTSSGGRTAYFSDEWSGGKLSSVWSCAAHPTEVTTLICLGKTDPAKTCISNHVLLNVSTTAQTITPINDNLGCQTFTAGLGDIRFNVNGTKLVVSTSGSFSPSGKYYAFDANNLSAPPTITAVAGNLFQPKLMPIN